MKQNKYYLVTNRSAGLVGYALPELGIKNREFQPGETKKISAEELASLSYRPGGTVLMRDYLIIQNVEARQELIGKVEPEYNMTPEDIKNLILNGSMDEWLDCLDFAPQGVIDLVQTLSIELPLTDTQKMATFKEKKGIDIARAIKAKEEEAAELAASAQAEKKSSPQRRVQPKTEEQPTTGRRTSGSKYKVISREDKE